MVNSVCMSNFQPAVPQPPANVCGMNNIYTAVSSSSYCSKFNSCLIILCSCLVASGSSWDSIK